MGTHRGRHLADRSADERWSIALSAPGGRAPDRAAARRPLQLRTLADGERARPRARLPEPALPPPPVRLSDMRPGAAVHSVLDLLLSPAASLPSALDVHPATLRVGAPRHRAETSAPARTPVPILDDEGDRRVERVRLLATGGAVAALLALSAGAVRLAL